jgi:hypothetical protein
LGETTFSIVAFSAATKDFRTGPSVQTSEKTIRFSRGVLPG